MGRRSRYRGSSHLRARNPDRWVLHLWHHLADSDRVIFERILSCETDADIHVLRAAGLIDEISKVDEFGGNT